MIGRVIQPIYTILLLQARLIDSVRIKSKSQSLLFIL